MAAAAAKESQIPPRGIATTPINLTRGWPAKDLLPANVISQAAQKVLAEATIANPGLLYGPDEGHEPLRTVVADWNSRFYSQDGREISKENIAITGGASQNLGCLLQVATDPVYTLRAWLLAPAYFMAFRIFQDSLPARSMRAVPEGEDGVDIAVLRKLMQQSEDDAQGRGGTDSNVKTTRTYSKYYRHVIYCVPTFSNPSSRTMSLGRRKELVKCARDFDALLISDDVYDHLQWPAQSTSPGPSALKTACLPRLVDIDAILDGGPNRPSADGFGNTVSNGSFSKILSPGLRVGWAEAAPKLAYAISQTGTTCSGGAPSQLTSTYVTELLTSGFVEQHIYETLQPTYMARYFDLVNAVERYLLPLGVKMQQPDRDIVGGFFVWLELPRTIEAQNLATRCIAEEGVMVSPGTLFEVPGDDSLTFRHHIRLCFSWEDRSRLVEGVQRVARVLTAMLGDQ